MVRKFLIIGIIIGGAIGIVYYMKDAPNPKYCTDKEIFATPEKTFQLLMRSFEEKDVNLYWKCRGNKPKQVKLPHPVQCEIVKIETYGVKGQFAYILWNPLKYRYSEEEVKTLKKQGWLHSSYFEKINERWVYIPESFYFMVKETLDWLIGKLT